MSEVPVIIEAAINGIGTKERNPHVPIGPEEIAGCALRCFDAGAAIVHAHNCDIALEGAAAAVGSLREPSARSAEVTRTTTAPSAFLPCAIEIAARFFRQG